MSDDDIVRIYTEMEEMFGTLPSHIHEPLQFAYLVKLYLRRNEGRNEGRNESRNDPRIS